MWAWRIVRASVATASSLCRKLQAEHDLHMLKVQQKIFGTFCSETGATASGRIRSYLSTMRKQGQAMLDALAAVFAGHPLAIAWGLE